MTREYDDEISRKLSLIVILLAIALIISMGYISYSVLKKNSYALGFQDGQTFVINQIQNNQIPVVYQNKELNKTKIKYVSLGYWCEYKKVCKGK